jgi:isopenicillin-N N-acyltransferase-like protein
MDGNMAHTNHYITPTMKGVENDPEELISSRVRYFRANRLLRQNSTHTIKTLQAIQKDHVNLPNSICNHNIEGIDPLDRESTISALVIDLTSREMHIVWGNPCQNAYHTYHLND